MTRYRFKRKHELFINSIDLSPYIVDISETGNIIGIKAPPELLGQMFLDLRIGDKKAVIYLNGEILCWRQMDVDVLRGWVQIERKFEIQQAALYLWLRFDE